MTKFHFKTNFLADFFGKQQKVELDQDGILTISNDGKTFYSWEDIDSPPDVKLSLSGCVLSFWIHGREQTVPMLSYLVAYKHKRSFFPFWANSNAQKLRPFLNEVDHTLAFKFVRTSQIQRFQKTATQESKRWKGWRLAIGLTEQAQEVAKKLEQVSALSQSDIAAIRQSYIDKQLAEYSSFFEEVESNPLTEKQRIACITDNDNNLLLAGAGTGKTSVMVGRTGYLIQSGQAAANDILLLAYGRIAAKEMDERIREKLGFDDVRASTFHSLGMKIIAQVEGSKPTLSPFEDDAKAKSSWMNTTLEQLMLDNGYRESLLEYFSTYYYVDKNPFDFKSEGEYLKYLTDNDIRSLKGEQVKSYGEVVIANWLFRQGINYEYEPSYRFDVSTDRYRQYHPDFYLPDYDIYIEYYGTDEDGNTLPWIDKERYNASMEWKRETHQKYQTGYVEVFYHQHKAGKLLSILESQLLDCGVDLNPKPEQELLDNLKQLGQVTELAKLFSALVDMYKAACLDQVAIESIIRNSIDPKQTEKALDLLYPLYHRYELFLREKQWIDFNDMIGKALNYIQTGQFVSPWKYILVDEFQDISEPRARLVRALRDSLPGTSLFCVGDDWQAIYRFSGADVKLTTSFRDYFGATSKTKLDLTFRFNSAIGNVATQFVTQNPVQIKKDIQSLVKVKKPAVSILRQGWNEQGFSPLDKALNAVVACVSNSGKPTQNKVYLLARFWHQMPDYHQLKQINSQYPSLNIVCQSFHASKGKEADYVIIMGLTTGKHGFPSQKITPPLVDALLPKGDDYEFAEERRLFYVALTRAKHRAYLLADMTDVSDFVIELMKQKYYVETDEFDASLVQKLFEQISCSSCKTGILKERVGQYGKFMSCSFYPRCKHKETPCDQCGSPMSSTSKLGFQECINEECGDIRPLCQRCGSEMKLRKGQFGQFWSCSTYRKDKDKNCGYTQNVDA
ncbi:UvrD-helicase domain-containing protein [Vibrio brasiliensis]|uniref:UvrD-helicase domain-containing protein n=1 Tax=Vibrio brasiliensis TaxID=170652 RepID=UPI001EFDA74E|nr:UvrD-helicase domain-containing protein [Vibrio brasiliensis]MCG9648780.1 UvrD-helicase domain-containing protein [Vibrio brasiliensis]